MLYSTCLGYMDKSGQYPDHLLLIDTTSGFDILYYNKCCQYHMLV